MMPLLRLAAALVLLVVPPAITAYPQAANGPAESPLEETLISYEKQTWELYKNRDVKRLAEFASEDFYDIYVTGEVADKKRYLQDVFDIEVKDYSLSDFKVIRLNEAAAIVVYQAKAHGIIKGREVRSQVAVTSGWARRDGKWLNVFYRENLIELDGRRLL